MEDEFRISMKLRVFLFSLHMLCNHFVEYIFTRQTFGLAESDTQQFFVLRLRLWPERSALYIIYMESAIIDYCQQLPICFYLKRRYVTSEESTERREA